MSEFLNGMALSFAWFANHADPEVESHASISYVNTQINFSVKFTGRIASEVPEKMCLQNFDKKNLHIIAMELEIELKKAAILLAVRNAWIAYFLENIALKVSVDGIRLLLTNEISFDYVVLTSNKWSEHPWMQEQINQPRVEDNHHLTGTYQEIHYSPFTEEQLRDISFCLKYFRLQKGQYKSRLDVDADDAEHDIENAKKRLGELHSDHRTAVEQQEKIIREAKIPIRKFKNYEKALKKGEYDPQKKSKELLLRRDVATKFVANWVGSLMKMLSIDSCGELAKLLGGQKVTWWRWQNEKQLPPSSYLKSLLQVEIKSGVYKSTKLCHLQTTPSLIDLVALIDLV